MYVCCSIILIKNRLRYDKIERYYVFYSVVKFVNVSRFISYQLKYNFNKTFTYVSLCRAKAQMWF